MEYTFILYALVYLDVFSVTALVSSVGLVYWHFSTPTELMEAITRKGAYTPWIITIIVRAFIAIPVIWVALYIYIEAIT